MSDQGSIPGSREQFLERFGDVVENSPWVASAVWERYPSAAKGRSFDDLQDAFSKVIRTAPHEQRLDLLCAHPDLACGVVASRELTDASRAEQESAGLDRCSPQEFIELQSLNLEYKAQFGFPFIIAVKGMHRREILERFRNRVERSQEEELMTAIENVIRIVGYRIQDVLRGHA
jgi:2-oxo-4-hydroxy-4-carboxy-5-ureidoimidazoline decarboxylase